jgi:predicted Holliday junction resolvase-like endonuclease
MRVVIIIVLIIVALIMLLFIYSIMRIASLCSREEERKEINEYLKRSSKTEKYKL